MVLKYETISIHSKNSCKNMRKLLSFEPTSPAYSGEYRVSIEKNGKFHCCIVYTGMSGTAMMDILPDIRKEFPIEKGYKVDW